MPQARFGQLSARAPRRWPAFNIRPSHATARAQFIIMTKQSPEITSLEETRFTAQYYFALISGKQFLSFTIIPRHDAGFRAAFKNKMTVLSVASFIVVIIIYLPLPLAMTPVIRPFLRHIHARRSFI